VTVFLGGGHRKFGPLNISGVFDFTAFCSSVFFYFV
jgi:hypothetical protein